MRCWVASVSSGIGSWTDYRASARLCWSCGCMWIVQLAQDVPTVMRIGSSDRIPKNPAYMTEYICIYVNIYKFTCTKVDENMYTTGLCTYIYIYTCILVYICLLELKMLCASRVPGGEVLKASNKFILVNYNFAPANNSLWFVCWLYLKPLMLENVILCRNWKWCCNLHGRDNSC
jgi:hypothetical protein